MIFFFEPPNPQPQSPPNPLPPAWGAPPLTLSISLSCSGRMLTGRTTLVLEQRVRACTVFTVIHAEGRGDGGGAGLRGDALFTVLVTCQSLHTKLALVCIFFCYYCYIRGSISLFFLALSAAAEISAATREMSREQTVTAVRGTSARSKRRADARVPC